MVLDIGLRYLSIIPASGTMQTGFFFPNLPLYGFHNAVIWITTLFLIV